ncbi:hypothetical protein LR013_02945 [candidate division NPL-UPA2 bacterium]|nr:hypothetical protein [candidate division NPL-UPA2 bacterium]
MRKLFSVLVAMVVFVGMFSSLALAGTVGSPIKPAYYIGEGWWLSAEVEMISRKELDPDKVREAEMEGEWGFLKMSSRVGERGEIYGKIGMSSLEGSLRDPVLGLPYGTKFDIKLDTDLALAAGGSTELWREEATALHLGGELRWTEPDMDRAELNGLSLDPAGREEVEIWEWQVSLAVSREFDQFVPYLGLRYSDSDVDFGTLATYNLGKGENENNIGGFAGLGLIAEDGTFALSFEGRFFDEEAWTIAFHWFGW